jgi:uncharacterized C2H2 Zn-finger protein
LVKTHAPPPPHAMPAENLSPLLDLSLSPLMNKDPSQPTPRPRDMLKEDPSQPTPRAAGHILKVVCDSHYFVCNISHTLHSIKCRVFLTSFEQHSTIHMCSHTQEKPFQCPNCPKAFSSASPLINHLRTHTKEKPYKCSECDKTFTQSNSLATHRRIHAGDTPFKCSECDQAFNQKSNLTKQLRTHAGERPFQCTQFEWAFNLSTNLSRHLRTHHE